MAENSKIEWTNHTFNPWIGCSKVSSGCKNCYAETLMDKRYGRVTWGDRGTRVRTSKANWRTPMAWAKQARETGTRPRVFCASLADVFEDRPELVEWRRDLWGLIAATAELDWLLLTKRPENVIPMMAMEGLTKHTLTRVLKNVWLGTSLEDQASADKRIPELLKVPCKVRFLSCEPLLGVVDLYRGGWSFLEPLRPPPGNKLGHERGVDWVIVGGESGSGARPMDLAWARSIRDQCAEAGVPFFMKQVDKIQPIPDDLMIREFPNA